MRKGLVAAASALAAAACGGSAHGRPVARPAPATAPPTTAVATAALPLSSALLRPTDLPVKPQGTQTHAGAAPAGDMTAPGSCARPVSDAYREGLALQRQQVTRDFPLGSAGAVSEVLIEFRSRDDASRLSRATVRLLTSCPTSVSTNGGHHFTTTAVSIRPTADGYTERFTSAVDGAAASSATQVLRVRGAVWVLVVGFGPGMPPARVARLADTAAARAAGVLHL